MKKLIFTLVVLVALGFLGWKIREKLAEAKASGRSPQNREAVVAVEVTHVARKTVLEVSSLSGSIQPRTQFVVAPKVAGRLEKLLVNMHDPVNRGQLIARLDDAEYVQEVEQAQADVAAQQAQIQAANAEVDAARSAVEIGKREYDRMKNLKEKQVASAAQLDTVQAQYVSQQAQLAVAQAKLVVTEKQLLQKREALKAARIRLSYTRIHAVWEQGDAERLVGKRFVDEGAMLRANDPIVSVLDIDTVLAVLHVIGPDYDRIKQGQEVRLTTDDGKNQTKGRLFIGKVLRKSPALEEKTRQAAVEVEIPNADHVLRPGYFMRAEVELTRKTNATVVPRASLTRRNRKSGVFTVDLKTLKARFVPIEVGIISGEDVEVVRPELSGVVVSIGQHLLGENSTVVIPNGVPPENPDPDTGTPAPKPDQAPPTPSVSGVPR